MPTITLKKSLLFTDRDIAEQDIGGKNGKMF